VIYVCNLSNISVIVCTDMVNVYNRTSRRKKNPTVHSTNACESRSHPFTDAETRQKMKSEIEENILAQSQLTLLVHCSPTKLRGQREYYNLDDACLKEKVKADFIKMRLRHRLSKANNNVKSC